MYNRYKKASAIKKSVIEMMISYNYKQKYMEKPRAFDPRGQSGVDPRKPFCFDPCKVLTDGVIFILPDYFLAFIFLMLSPVSSIRCDEWTILSSTASATAWSPMASYQFSTGSCDAITIDFLS